MSVLFFFFPCWCDHTSLAGTVPQYLRLLFLCNALVYFVHWSFPRFLFLTKIPLGFSWNHLSRTSFFFIIPTDFPSATITCTLEFLPSFRFYCLKLHDSFVYLLPFTSATVVLRSRFPSTIQKPRRVFKFVYRYIDIDFYFIFWI